MGYYLGTFENCTLYDQQVTRAENYPGRDNWANPKKHPLKNKWYIEAHPKYATENLTFVETLPEEYYKEPTTTQKILNFLGL